MEKHSAIRPIVKGTQDGKPLPRDRWNTSALVVVAVGENTESYFHDGAKALVELLPNAHYVVLEGLDHGAFWVGADKIAKALNKAFSKD
jgi:pimeloyl-ACP methyl ester carboxylesterase